VAELFVKHLRDRETLTETPQGLTGRRVYLVGTGNASRALAAAGVPVGGDAFDEENADVVVQQRTTSRMGGTDGVSGGGGWTTVEIDYAVNGGGGSWKPTEPGTRYTDAGFNQRTIKLYTAPADGHTEISGAGAAMAFNNGQGEQAEVAELAVKVMAYYDHGAMPSLATMLAYCNKVNLNAVELPPLLGSTQRLVLAAGQLRVRAPVFKPKGRSIEVAWECVLAADHYTRWRNEKGDGTLMPLPPADPYYARLYQRATLPDYFPG